MQEQLAGWKRTELIRKESFTTYTPKSRKQYFINDCDDKSYYVPNVDKLNLDKCLKLSTADPNEFAALLLADAQKSAMAGMAEQFLKNFKVYDDPRPQKEKGGAQGSVLAVSTTQFEEIESIMFQRKPIPDGTKKTLHLCGATAIDKISKKKVRLSQRLCS